MAYRDLKINVTKLYKENINVFFNDFETSLKNKDEYYTYKGEEFTKKFVELTQNALACAKEILPK